MTKPTWARSAPGLVWKIRRNGYEARWQCRTDLIERGFNIKSQQLWTGDAEPTAQEWAYIETTCNELQQEMLVFGRGGLPTESNFDGTLESLMQAYRSDPDSTYKTIRYKTRLHYDDTMRLIAEQYGHEPLSELNARILKRWHESWAAGGKIASGHIKIAMVRTLVNFGATFLEDENCQRLAGLLSNMKFKMGAPRVHRLTSDQVIALRKAAHELRRPSIALAQAFQFECMFRQMDCIGCWVPVAEPGISDVIHKGWKWLRGIRWEEIDQNLTLSHVTSKKEKKLTINLNNAPMVLEELAMFEDRPTNGPIILSEFDCLPWETPEYRRWWRICADRAGIPKEVKSMDTRSGAISEATDAGAELEHVRHAATHSNINMTTRYSRGSDEKIEKVQRMRLMHRNKSGTKDE